MVGFDAFSFFRNGALKKTGLPDIRLLRRSLTFSPLKKWLLEDKPFLLGGPIFRGELLNLRIVMFWGMYSHSPERKPSKETLPKSCSKNWWIPEGRRAAFKQWTCPSDLPTRFGIFMTPGWVWATKKGYRPRVVNLDWPGLVSNQLEKRILRDISSGVPSSQWISVNIGNCLSVE